MKKLSILFAALLMACATNVFGETFTITFNQNTSDGNNELTKFADIKPEIIAGANLVSSVEGSKVYPGTSGIKLGSSKAAGNMTITLTQSYKITNIVVNAVQYGSDNGKIICGSSNSNKTTTATTLGTKVTPCSFDFEGTDMSTIYVATSAKRAYISSIVVTYGAATSPMLMCQEAVDFGSIPTNIETAPAKTLSIIGKNLTEDIVATLSEGAQFSIDKTTLSADGGDIIITANTATIGSHNATLTLKSGETTATVALSSTILDVYQISWNVNGKEISTTNVIDGEALVLPADPKAPSACSAKTFVGWATESTVNADGTDITWVTSSTIPTADVTYYAVFALVEESTESTTATIDFSKKGYDNQQNFEGVKIAIDENVSATFAKAEGQNEPKYYNSGTAIRLYSGGTLTISSVATMSKVEITFGRKDNAITSDVEKWDDDTNVWEGNVKKIVLAAEYSEKGGHARFQAISVTYKKSTTSDYTTICNGTTTDTQDATAPKAQTIIKTIENGQLVITIDGTSYNAQGQVIE